MPYPNRISLTNKIKRLLVVIFAVAISISALGRMGLQLNSFAAIDQNQAKIVQVKDRAATQPPPADRSGTDTARNRCRFVPKPYN